MLLLFIYHNFLLFIDQCSIEYNIKKIEKYYSKFLLQEDDDLDDNKIPDDEKYSKINLITELIRQNYSKIPIENQNINKNKNSVNEKPQKTLTPSNTDINLTSDIKRINNEEDKNSDYELMLKYEKLQNHYNNLLSSYEKVYQSIKSGTYLSNKNNNINDINKENNILDYIKREYPNEDLIRHKLYKIDIKDKASKEIKEELAYLEFYRRLNTQNSISNTNKNFNRNSSSSFISDSQESEDSSIDGIKKESLLSLPYNINNNIELLELPKEKIITCNKSNNNADLINSHYKCNKDLFTKRKELVLIKSKIKSQNNIITNQKEIDQDSELYKEYKCENIPNHKDYEEFIEFVSDDNIIVLDIINVLYMVKKLYYFCSFFDQKNKVFYSSYYISHENLKQKDPLLICEFYQKKIIDSNDIKHKISITNKKFEDLYTSNNNIEYELLI